MGTRTSPRRPDGDEAIKKGTGVASAEYLPGVRLVRAFNALSFVQVEREAHRAGEKLGIPVAGDDQAAVATVVRLVQDAGFDPVVVGGLARAREFDTGTPVYVKGLTARQLREALKLPNPKRAYAALTTKVTHQFVLVKNDLFGAVPAIVVLAWLVARGPQAAAREDRLGGLADGIRGCDQADKRAAGAGLCRRVADRSSRPPAGAVDDG